jgi:hypothetical protein
MVRQAALAATLALVSLLLAAGAAGHAAADVRVTVFGDSAATAMAYDPSAKRMLSRGIDHNLEVAACRRLGDTSCPYDGVRPPNVIDRAKELGADLGPVVVVVVGYNDYEANYAENIDDAMAVFRKAGVQHVLWATLRAGRQSYADMNDMILAAAKKYPEITVLDWDAASRNEPDWLQPDGIHLTPTGAEGMAAMIEDALVQLGVAPSAPPPPSRQLLAIASRSLPTAHEGRRYAATLRATGGRAPYRWTRTGGSIAPGLRLAVNGKLAGVPAKTGTFRLRVRVVDGAGTARARILSLRVVG